jgi:hypothetical protein
MAFNPNQPRDPHTGQWVGVSVSDAESAPLGAKFVSMEGHQQQYGGPEVWTKIGRFPDVWTSRGYENKYGTDLFRKKPRGRMMTTTTNLSNSRSDTDLAFNRAEPRDKFGRWVGKGFFADKISEAADALRAAPAGSKFTAKRSGTSFRKDNLGSWKDDSGTAYGEHDMFQHTGLLGFLQSPDDLAREHNAVMAKRDRALLARGKRKDLSNEQDGVDLAFGPPRPKKGVAAAVAPQARRQQARVMRRQVKTFKKQFGNADHATLVAHASQPGHLRAKAILAAQSGHVRYARKLTAQAHAKYVSNHPQAHAQTGVQHPATVKRTQNWTKHTNKVVQTATQARPQVRQQPVAKPAVTAKAKRQGTRRIVQTGMANKRKGLSQA